MTVTNEHTTANPNKSWRSNRLWMIVSAALLITLLIYIFTNPPGQSSQETVATVNGTKITKEQLYQALVITGGEQTLANMIERELLNQEADKAGVKVTDADIDEELAYVKSSFGSDEEFDYTMMMYGLTLEQLKSDLYMDIQLRKLLGPCVTVTDEEVEAYYEENLAYMTTPEQVKASHIVLPTREEAEAVRQSLINGADFAALAAEKSIDEDSKEHGGELELIARGDGEEAFEDALFALQVGMLSDVVETSEGYHVIKLTERHAEIIPTLEEQQDDIRETLISDQIRELAATWIEEVRAAADIQNTLFQ